MNDSDPADRRGAKAMEPKLRNQKSLQNVLLMEEILHQLIWQIIPVFAGFYI